MMSHSVSTEKKTDSESSKVDIIDIPRGLQTPVMTKPDIGSSSKVTCVMSEVDLESCCTPLTFSQNSFLSHSQEVIPISHFHEQLQQLSLCLGGEASLTVLSPSSELIGANSHTNVLESLESSPGSSRHPSFDTISISGVCSLPTRKEIIHSIYERMREYLQEEIQRRTNVPAIAAKTPGKLELCCTSFCPPIKRIDRRLRLSSDPSKEPIALKRVSISL